MMKTSLIRAGMVNFDQFSVCKLGRADERIHGEDCRYEWQFTAVSSGIDTNTYLRQGFLDWLDQVRSIGRQLDNGVGEDMDALLSEFDLSVHARGASWK